MEAVEGLGSAPLLQGQPELQDMGGGAYLLRWWSNSCFFLTDEGAVVFDAGFDITGPLLVKELRRLSEAPVRFIIYGHGHADHAFGAGAFIREAEERGYPRPTVLAQERLPARFDRYRRTRAYQERINRIQFGIPEGLPAFVSEFVYPDRTFRGEHSFRLGGLTFRLREAMGETDDACWLWVPELSCAAVSDLWIWSCPNIGNPLKVQRYELEWAEALEEVATLGAQAVLPGHGPALRGGERIREALGTVARALRFLSEEVVGMLNLGMWPGEILRSFRWPEEFAASPYLAPIYGQPLFAVHGILRRYHGWYDGEPAHLFPPPREEVSRELLSMAGGGRRLLERVRELREKGESLLALHIVNIVAAAEGPEREEAYPLKAELLEELASREESLIARNILLAGAREARGLAGGPSAR